MPGNDLQQLPVEILDAAAAWHQRTAAVDATESDWLAFTAWLEADPRHRVAYDLVEHADETATAQAGALRKQLQPQDLQAAVLPFRPAAPARVSRRQLWLGAATALAASIAIAMVTRSPDQTAPAVTAYATGVGEQREVALADGSRVRLNTNSRIAVTLAGDARRISLDRGEAFFDVAKDPQRPFIVTVADQEVRVVGTAFNILHDDGTVTVSVARGVVEVRTGRSAGPAATPTRLTVGDRVRHVVGERTVATSKFNPAQAASWQEGRLIFENAPLSEVISQVNRYFVPQIRAQDPAVRALRFSGVIQIDDPQAVVDRLTGFLPINAQQTADGFMLDRKAVE